MNWFKLVLTWDWRIEFELIEKGKKELNLNLIQIHFRVCIITVVFDTSDGLRWSHCDNILWVSRCLIFAMCKMLIMPLFEYTVCNPVLQLHSYDYDQNSNTFIRRFCFPTIFCASFVSQRSFVLLIILE